MSIPDDPTVDLSNPVLSEAMAAVAERDTPERRQILYRALLDSILIVPTPDAVDENPELLAAEDEDLNFLTYENDAGDTMLIAFTSEDAALNWEPEGLSYIGLRGQDLMQVTVENEIEDMVLNPAGPQTFILDREEIAALAEGRVPDVAGERPPTEGMTVLIGPPEEMPPDDWQSALREVLGHYPSVETAYFFQLHIPPAGSRHVIGLVLYEGMSREAQERLIADMLKEFETLLPQGQELDFVVLDEPDFRRTVEDTVNPIYEA
jgi:hypothetical protein